MINMLYIIILKVVVQEHGRSFFHFLMSVSVINVFFCHQYFLKFSLHRSFMSLVKCILFPYSYGEWGCFYRLTQQVCCWCKKDAAGVYTLILYHATLKNLSVQMVFWWSYFYGGCSF